MVRKLANSSRATGKCLGSCRNGYLFLQLPICSKGITRDSSISQPIRQERDIRHTCTCIAWSPTEYSRVYSTTLLLIMSTDACIMHTTHACMWIYFVLLNFTTEAVVWPIRWSDRPRVNLETGLVFSACDV